MTDTTTKINIFIAYAREDAAYLKELRKQLRILERSKQVDKIWYDGEIAAGQEWEKAIKNAMETADIFLLLLSADFINSDYCYGVEMEEALARHEAGTSTIIPVVLRDCAWHYTPLSKIQAPVSGQAIAGSAYKDALYKGIVDEIVKISKEKRQQKQENSNSSNHQPQEDIYNYGESEISFLENMRHTRVLIKPSLFLFVSLILSLFFFLLLLNTYDIFNGIFDKISLIETSNYEGDKLGDLTFEEGSFSQKLNQSILSSSTENKSFPFDKIYFESGTGELVERSKKQLDNLTIIMETYPTIEIQIASFVLETGLLPLAQSRADLVRFYLVGKGIEPNRVSATGYVSEKNRRTSVIVNDK